MRFRMILTALVVCAVTACASAQDAPRPDKPGEKAGPEKTTDKEEGKAGDENKGKEDAGDAEEKPAPNDTVARHKRLLKDISDVIGTVTVSEADVKSWLDHRADFEKAMLADEDFGAKRAVSLKQAFDHALTSEVYTAWAKGENLNAEDWLRKSLRIKVLNYRLRALKEAPEQREALKAKLEKIEGEKQNLSTGEYENAKAAIADTQDLLTKLETYVKTLPEPSEPEKKALETHADELK